MTIPTDAECAEIAREVAKELHKRALIRAGAAGADAGSTPVSPTDAAAMVDQAFYKLTVSQRDAAWRECDALRAAVERRDECLWRVYEAIYGHRDADGIDPFETAARATVEVVAHRERLRAEVERERKQREITDRERNDALRASMHDMTARQKAEAALREARALLCDGVALFENDAEAMIPGTDAYLWLHRARAAIDAARGEKGST